MSKRNRLDFEDNVVDNDDSDHQQSSYSKNTAEQELKRLKFHSPPSHTLSMAYGSSLLDDADSSSEAFKGVYYDDLPPNHADFITCIGSKEGDMCYLTFMEEEESTTSTIESMNNVNSRLDMGRSLLKTPFNELLEDVRRIRYEADIKKKANNSRKTTTNTTTLSDTFFASSSDVEIVDKKPKKFELLVDKYSPKSYLDLLTDDVCFKMWLFLI